MHHYSDHGDDPDMFFDGFAVDERETPKCRRCGVEDDDMRLSFLLCANCDRTAIK